MSGQGQAGWKVGVSMGSEPQPEGEVGVDEEGRTVLPFESEAKEAGLWGTSPSAWSGGGACSITLKKGGLILAQGLLAMLRDHI